MSETLIASLGGVLATLKMMGEGVLVMLMGTLGVMVGVVVHSAPSPSAPSIGATASARIAAGQ